MSTRVIKKKFRYVRRSKQEQEDLTFLTRDIADIDRNFPGNSLRLKLTAYGERVRSETQVSLLLDKTCANNIREDESSQEYW